METITIRVTEITDQRRYRKRIILPPTSKLTIQKLALRILASLPMRKSLRKTSKINHSLIVALTVDHDVFTDLSHNPLVLLDSFTLTPSLELVPDDFILSLDVDCCHDFSLRWLRQPFHLYIAIYCYLYIDIYLLEEEEEEEEEEEREHSDNASS